MKEKFIIFVFSFIVMVTSAQALRCYSCSVSISEGQTEDDVDLTCLNSPANATGKNIITCPSHMTYCVIIRNDFTDTGRLSSMVRNCAADGTNDDIDSPSLTTHYRACAVDLCNDGSGLEIFDPSNPGGNNDGAILVDDSGAYKMTFNLFFVLFTYMLVKFF